MASFEPIDFDPNEPPPRPTTPPVRRGFLLILLLLSVLTGLVYGIPFVAGRAGYAYEAGRARAAFEALEKLDEKGVLARTSSLFRLASTAAGPAVVHISVYRSLPEGMDKSAPAVIAAGAGRPGMVRTSTGSGVVIDKQAGFIVTNNHVVQGSEGIGVRFGRSDEIQARIVGTDPKTDLAVIQVAGPVEAEARWGDSETLDIGDWVLAIGSPFELDQTVTAGIVSANGRSNLRIVGVDSYEDFIQTDAAINPGNSGGPLVNLKGEVVGINAAILSENMGQGIGLAISSRLAKRVVEALIKDGQVARGYLGVVIDDVTGAEAREKGLPEPKGVLVREVEPGSPADRAGIRQGDVVVRLAGQAVDDASALRHKTASLPIGSEVPLAYYRDGQPGELPIRIDPLPARLVLGMNVREFGPPASQRFPDHPDLVLVLTRVEPGGTAARAGLVPGLRILAVGAAPIRDRAGFDAALAALDPAQGIPIRVQGPDGRTLDLTLGTPPSPPAR